MIKVCRLSMFEDFELSRCRGVSRSLIGCMAMHV